MKAKLSKSARALANGVTNDENREILQGVHITEKEVAVADGYIVVIKTLQSPEMKLEAEGDDGINEVVVPAYALKACEADAVQLSTIEALVSIPSPQGLVDGEKLKTPKKKIIARLDGVGYSVEADSIDGEYPKYNAMFGESPLIGQFALNTKLLKKLINTLPSDAMISFRVSEPDNPVEFACVDPDGDIPIKGVIMPLNRMWEDMKWQTKEVSVKEHKEEEKK